MTFMCRQARNRLGAEPWTHERQLQIEMLLLASAGYSRPLDQHAEILYEIQTDYLVDDYPVEDLIGLADLVCKYEAKLIRRTMLEIRPRGVYSIRYLCGALRRDDGRIIAEARRETRIQDLVTRSTRLTVDDNRDTYQDVDAVESMWRELETDDRIQQVIDEAT